MKNRPSLLLFVVFVGLLGAGYFINLQRQQAKPVVFPTAFPEVFYGILPTQISRIEIVNVQTGQKVKLTKIPGDWQAVNEKGATIPVDYRQVSRILEKLPNLRYRRIMQGTEIKDFGLSGGGFFTVIFEAGGPHTLHVGDLTSDQSLAYVQRDNDPQILQVSTDDIYTLISLVRPS